MRAPATCTGHESCAELNLWLLRDGEKKMLENNLYSQNLPASPLRPVSLNERIDAIDVLRGFAILGVLIAYAVWNLGSPPPETFTTPDKITNLILGIFVNSKAYTLLAFL